MVCTSTGKPYNADLNGAYNISERNHAQVQVRTSLRTAQWARIDGTNRLSERLAADQGVLLDWDGA